MSLILAAALIANLPLVVRTYDSAGVPSRMLARATDTAGITLAAIGVTPIWRPCHASGCAGKPKAHEVIVRLVTSTPLSERDSLGFAAVDLDQKAGTLATIYVDRVDILAFRSGVDRSTLLGRAIAHEIGHVMLGTAAHAKAGLMRATWRSDELHRDRPLDWVFSEAEGEQMRIRFAARTDSTPVQEPIVPSLIRRSCPPFGGPTAVWP